MTLTPEEKAYLLDGWEHERSCAHMLGITQRALAGLRRKGQAPPHIRLTPRGQVLYSREGIGNYLLNIYLDALAESPSTNPEVK